MSLLSIDKYILGRISSLLDVQDMMCLSRCCKSLKHRYDDDDIWNTMYSLNYVKRSNTFYKELYLKRQKKEYTTYLMNKLIDRYHKYTFGFKQLEDIKHDSWYIKDKFYVCSEKYIRFFIESFPDLIKNLLFNTEFDTQITFRCKDNSYVDVDVDVIMYFCYKNKYDLVRLIFDRFPHESRISISHWYQDNVRPGDKWSPFLLCVWDGYFDIAYLLINRYPLETLPSLIYIDDEHNDVFSALISGEDDDCSNEDSFIKLVEHILIYYKDSIIPGVIINLSNTDNCVFNNCPSYIMPVLYKYMNNELIQWLDLVKGDNECQLMYYAWKGFLSTI